MNIPIVGAVIDIVGNWLNKKQEIKAATKSAKAKIEQKKVDTNAEIALSDSEWEALSVQTQALQTG